MDSREASHTTRSTRNAHAEIRQGGTHVDHAPHARWTLLVSSRLHPSGRCAAIAGCSTPAGEDRPSIRVHHHHWKHCMGKSDGEVHTCGPQDECRLYNSALPVSRPTGRHRAPHAEPDGRNDMAV